MIRRSLLLDYIWGLYLGLWDICETDSEPKTHELVYSIQHVLQLVIIEVNENAHGVISVQ